MSYSCPDCEDGTLETKLREVDLELAEGESAFIVNGVAVITSVGCDNGCSADAEAEEEEGSRDLCDKGPWLHTVEGSPRSSMSDNTGIQWTDATWNPIRGCSRVSEGCRNCYAEVVAARFSGPGQPYEGLARRTSNGGARWTGKIMFVEKHLEDPASLEKAEENLRELDERSVSRRR
jgi:hypothetical protein